MTGQRELRQLAAQLRLEANRGVEAELRKQQQQAFGGLQEKIAANAAVMLPSGYAPIMSRAVRVGIILGTRGAFTVRAVVYARGGAQNRDVRVINAGRLKHPLFGNRKVSPWPVTRVPPGFVDRAVDDLPDEVYRQSQDAIDKVIARLTRG